MSTKRFVSPAEFQVITGFSSATVARRLKDRSIPFVKMGRKVLIPIAFLDELDELANQTTRASRLPLAGEERA